MNRSEKKTRPQRRERQLENAKKWEKWHVCWSPESVAFLRTWSPESAVFQ